MQEQVSPTVEIRKKPLHELLPQYILTITGVIYAAGFLVILVFLDRFGIREAGTDFWKTRYIHIGIICLAFPLIINGSILSLSHLIMHGRYNKNTMWQRLLPIGLLIVNLVIVCFVFLMLTNRTPTGSISGLNPLLWITSVTLLGILAVLLVDRVIESVARRPAVNEQEDIPAGQAFSVTGRWIIASVVAALDVWFFIEIKNFTAGVQPLIVLIYVGLSILLGIIISSVSIYERRQKREGRKRAVKTLAAAAFGPILYLVILSFSYGLYQNIPSTRGGGDFTLSPRVTVLLRTASSSSALDSSFFLKDYPSTTIPLVLIEESSWALYLANPKEAGGPTEWKSIGGRKPKILVISKDDVARLHSDARVP